VSITLPDYGYDISTLINGDIDPLMAATATGQHLVAERCARRLTTRRGGLFYDLNFGLDIRGYLNDTFTSATVFECSRAVESELEKDEEVASATATVTTPAPGTLRISVLIETALGPFQLVLSATQLATNIQVLKVL